MVRAYKLGSVVVGLAASGLAWGQSAQMPPHPAEAPAGKIVTISEPGKPAQKCRLLQQWHQPSGEKACQVQAIDSGEIMTIVQSGPPSAQAGSAPAKTMAMTIYHWNGTTPHPMAPKPPTMVQTTQVTPVMQASGAQPAAQSSAPATMPTITTPVNTASVFVQQPSATGAAQAAPMPQGPAGAGRASGPMTPGGTVPAPAGSIREISNCGPCGECCIECKPSLVDRIKGIFHRDSCTVTCCPDACTPCTPASTAPAKTVMIETTTPATNMPVKTVTVETTTPAPTTVTPASNRPLSGLFHRNKPVDSEVTITRTEMPKAETSKPDPLKEPAAYTPSKTTAELAGSTPSVAADTQKPAAAVVPAGRVPLGAGSVLQAGDTHYVPVPVVTVPDMRHPPGPPVTMVPQAPQPSQQFLNAFTGPFAPTTPAMPMGNMAYGAYQQGNPNMAGYGYGPMMGQAPYLPPMPAGPAVQPGFYGPPRSQGVAPVGYPMQPYMAPQRMPMQQSWNGTPDQQALLSQLRGGMLPSQREWAALKLAELDWHKNAGVVEALVQTAKEDPAASVRAGCVHCLVKMGANTQAVIATLGTLKEDSDPRVQQEACEALTKLAPGRVPTMLDPAVLPAGAVMPARSN